MVSEAALDAIVRDPRFAPYSGWHDDFPPGSETYFPAIQQDRAEFLSFLREAEAARGLSGRILCLGIGMAGGMHGVFAALSAETWSIDNHEPSVRQLLQALPDANVIAGSFSDPDVLEAAARHAPYSMLFIDGTHTYENTREDFEHYEPMVASGGVIAIHDVNAIFYPYVSRFVDELRTAGHHVHIVYPFQLGIAWLIKP